MSENNPTTPGGSVPPKPPEAAKVQPKKETVRISLPPKPTSSPTIKLPTMPAGGPAAPAAPGAAPAPAAAAPAGGAPPAPRPPTAGAPGLSVAGAAPAAAPAAPAGRPATNTGAPAGRPPGAPTPAPRPAASGGARKISGLDMGLGIAAAVVGVGAVVSLVLLMGLK
jgi:translation initiation factor IF-2